MGFAAKLALFGAAIDAGFSWLALLAVVNTVVSIFYYLRIVGVMYLGSATGRVALLEGSSRLVLGVSALLTILLGLGAQMVFGDDFLLITALR